MCPRDGFSAACTKTRRDAAYQRLCRENG